MTKADAVTLFEDLVRRDDSAIRLPAAALAVARVAYPSLSLTPHLGMLSDMGKVAEHRLSAVASADDRVARLNHYVFGELGFRGNRKSYYDPRNSFLNDVLERRLGIPITLALVYIEIASACRIPVEGIGFPGHFLVRDVTTGWILDPYNGGQRREVADCRELFVDQGFDPKTWSEDLLVPVSKRQFLLRMINNLRRHYSDAGDAVRLAMLEAMASAVAGAGERGPMPMLH